MPVNNLVCIWVLTTSWVQGARGQHGSKLNLAPITPLTLLPSLPSLPPHWTSLPMSNEQLSMYLGPHHLWGQGARGQGGSKLKLAPLTPRSLPLLPSPCCHSPHSQLAGPCSQCPMNSLLCIGVSTTSGGKGLGGNMGASWSWLPLLPPYSSLLQLIPSLLQLTPARSQLTPACSQLPACSSSLPACSSSLPAHSSSLPAPSLLQLTPSLLQLAPNGHVCVGVPTTCGV